MCIQAAGGRPGEGDADARTLFLGRGFVLAICRAGDGFLQAARRLFVPGLLTKHGVKPRDHKDRNDRQDDEFNIHATPSKSWTVKETHISLPCPI